MPESPGPLPHSHGPPPVRDRVTSCPDLPGMEGLLGCGTCSTKSGKVPVPNRMSRSPLSVTSNQPRGRQAPFNSFTQMSAGHLHEPGPVRCRAPVVREDHALVGLIF